MTMFLCVTKMSYASDEEIRWLGLHLAAAIADIVLAVEKNKILHRRLILALITLITIDPTPHIRTAQQRLSFSFSVISFSSVRAVSFSAHVKFKYFLFDRLMIKFKTHKHYEVIVRDAAYHAPSKSGVIGCNNFDSNILDFWCMKYANDAKTYLRYLFYFSYTHIFNNS